MFQRGYEGRLRQFRTRFTVFLLLALISLVILIQSASRAQDDYTSGVWWGPDEGRVFPQRLSYENEFGIVTTLNESGPTDTEGHPFFTSIGRNGRACVTCHQPADGMSLSVDTIRKRWRDTQGRDPLFAAIDGSDCPSLPQEKKSSHSLLLDRGLFRIFRPWPPKGRDGSTIEPQFDIEIVRDPTGCNTDPVYGLHSDDPMVSVYRRPRPATNLKYITESGFSFEPKDGLPLRRDPETGKLINGNILADARVDTLRGQAIDAFRTHLEGHGSPKDKQLEDILAFVKSLYTAQTSDKLGGSLTDDGAEGGPAALAAHRPAQLNSSRGRPMWDEFESWMPLLEGGGADLPDKVREFRKSVARGIKLFRERTFLVRDNAGINSMNFGNPVRNDCNFCHNRYHFGNDLAPGQVDLGTTNEPYADPSPGLPLFRLTCKDGYPPHPFLGKVVLTHDPGYALTTGRCVDIGKITIQSMRGLAARPPYFSDGSAETILDIVEYYNRRYDMELTEQEKQDLANMMRVL